MRRCVQLTLVGYVAVFASAFTQAADDAKPAKINYVEHVQPILREHCYSCHNQDQAKSDLALDSYAATMKGGAGGEVVWAGEPEMSRLWMLVAHKESPRMPPEQDKLSESKLTTIKQWILDGALEASGSTAKLKKKPKVDLTATASTDQPTGPPPMPSGLFREPYVTSTRAGAITALAANPWSPLIAVAGQKQVLLYNSDSAELVGVLPFPEGTPQSLRFSRNGSILACGGGRGGHSGRVVLFDVRTGARITEVGEEVDAVLASDISPSQALVALGSPRRVVRVYSVADGSLEWEARKHTDWVYAMEFSPNGKYLATSDRSGGILIWDAETGREYQNLVGHTAAVTGVSWRSDSQLLATASEDGSIKVWKVDTGSVVKSWAAHGGGVAQVMYARDGRLVSCGRDKAVKVWGGDGQAIKSITEFAEPALEVVFSHDGARIVAGDWSGDIRLWDAKEGKLIARWVQNPPTLAQLLTTQQQQVAAVDQEAKQATADVEVARKSAQGATEAVQQGQQRLDAVTKEIKRLETVITESDRRSTQLGTDIKSLETSTTAARAALEKVTAERKKQEQLLKTAREKLAAADKRFQDANSALSAAQKTAAAARKSVEAADAQLASAKAERAKLPADVSADKSKPVDERIKKLEDEARQAMARRDEANKNETQLSGNAKTADAARAESKAAAEKLQQQLAAEEKAVEAARAKLAPLVEKLPKFVAERQATIKAKADAAQALKSAQGQQPALKADLDKLIAAKAAAEKAVAEKQQLAQAAQDRAGALRASIERTKSEKAALEKARTAQASAR